MFPRRLRSVILEGWNTPSSYRWEAPPPSAKLHKRLWDRSAWTTFNRPSRYSFHCPTVAWIEINLPQPPTPPTPAVKKLHAPRYYTVCRNLLRTYRKSFSKTSLNFSKLLHLRFRLSDCFHCEILCPPVAVGGLQSPTGHVCPLAW